MSLISMLCPRCLGDSFERDHAYKCRPLEPDMTPTFPPSPTQGETAGVSEVRIKALLNIAHGDMDALDRVDTVIALQDLLAARQQLAEMRGRWVPWNHGDALPATAPVLHWTTWFDKEYTDVPMMRANHAHDFERWGVIAYWSIPLPPAHDATRGQCETCSGSGRLFESTVVPEDTEIPCPDCTRAALAPTSQPSRGKP